MRAPPRQASFASGYAGALGVTIWDALMWFALLVGGVTVTFGHLALAAQGHPRPWLYSWAGSTGLAAIGVTCLILDLGGAPGVAVVTGLAVGPTVLPVIVAYFCVSDWVYTLQYGGDDDTPEAVERARYRAKDFDQPVATRPPPSEAAPPPTPKAPPPPMWNGETKRVLAILALSLIVAIPGLVAFWPRPVPPAREVLLAERLADDGHPAARVTRMAGGDCRPGEVAYRWSAPGEEGTICDSPEVMRYSLDRIWEPDRPDEVAKAAAAAAETREVD